MKSVKFYQCLVDCLLGVNSFTNAQIPEKGTVSGTIREYCIINRDLNTISIVELNDPNN